MAFSPALSKKEVQKAGQGTHCRQAAASIVPQCRWKGLELSYYLCSGDFGSYSVGLETPVLKHVR